MNFSEFLKQDEQKNNTNNINQNMQRQQHQQRPKQRNVVKSVGSGFGNRQLQTQQFKELPQNRDMPPPVVERPITVLTARCVNVDSRDRNRDQFPGSNSFQVQMNPSDTFVGAALFTNFKNIYSIRLVNAVVPDFTADEPYLSLVIPELQDTMAGTNDVLKKSFAMLYPERVHGSFLSCQVKDMCYCFKKFTPPLANLRSLTFQFYDPDGVLYDFGTDAASSSPVVNTVQVMLTLEITTVESSRKGLEAMPIWT